MEDQSNCSEDSMKNMLLEGRVDALYRCLWAKCYPNSRRFVLRAGGSEQDAEDTFADAVYILIYKKLPNAAFQLFGSIGGFVHAIVRNLWLKKLESLKRMPKSGLDTLVFWNEEDEFSLLASLFPESTNAIRSCLARMGNDCVLDKIKPSPCQAPDEALFPEWNQTPVCVVLYMKYYADAQDKEVAPLVGYANVRGVAELRRRCRNDLKICLQKNYPGLFDF